MNKHPFNNLASTAKKREIIRNEGFKCALIVHM